MIGFIEAQIAIALIALGYAGIYDLKTTDIPNISPYTMAISGIILNGIHSVISGNYSYIIWSLALGLGFFAFGFLLYYTRQWGGGDAKLLSGLGFLLPIAPIQMTSILPYPLILLINIFLVGAVYSIFYAIVVSFRTPGFFDMMKNDLSSNKGRMSIIFLSATGGMFLLSFVTALVFGKMNMLGDVIIMQTYLIPVILFLVILWRFVKVVDSKIFKREVPVNELEEGDVIVEDVELEEETLKAELIEGLTEEQVETIKEEKDTVKILDAVRFGPVFFLALVVTLLGFSII